MLPVSPFLSSLAALVGRRTSPACGRRERNATARTRSSETCTRPKAAAPPKFELGVLSMLRGLAGSTHNTLLQRRALHTPLPALVVPLVLEAHGDLVVSERPHCACKGRFCQRRLGRLGKRS